MFISNNSVKSVELAKASYPASKSVSKVSRVRSFHHNIELGFFQIYKSNTYKNFTKVSRVRSLQYIREFWHFKYSKDMCDSIWRFSLNSYEITLASPLTPLTYLTLHTVFTLALYLPDFQLVILLTLLTNLTLLTSSYPYNYICSGLAPFQFYSHFSLYSLCP